MKNFILLALVLAILTLWFGGCKQPAGEQDLPNDGGPSFTIKNESSYDLSNVTWAGINFVSPGQTDLRKGTASKTETTEDASGYIYLTRKDIGINLRTQSVWTTDDSPVTIGDNAVVVEVANESNMGTLSAVGLVAEIGVEYGGRSVARNDTINTGETVINTARQIQITLKSTGSGNLALTGVEPVQLDGVDNSFSATQPTRSEITASTPLNALITFTPASLGPHTTTVTIKSNAPSGDFTFTISGTGVPTKPVISVFYNNAEIPQHGTINGGSASLGLMIPVTVKNTGTLLLTLDTGSIALIGADASAFTLSSSPSPNIPAGSESSFFIQFSPAKLGVHNAIITIPSNDASKNPAMVYLEVNVLPLSAPSNFTASAQSGTAINLSWDPVEGAGGYRVYRSTFDGNYGNPLATVSGGTSWYDTGLALGTAYYYKIGAYYGALDGSLSGYVRAVTFIPVSFTGAEANGSSSVMTTKLNLSFDQDIEDLSAGDITLMPNNTGAVKGALAKIGIGVYELAVSGISAGGSVTVAAAKNGYTITPSGKEATLYFVPPAVPTGAATAVLSASSIRVSWSAVPGAASYEIYYQKGSTSASMNYAGTSPSASYTHTGLSPETTYYYSIKAVNSAGASGYSSSVSGTTQQALPPPSAPTGVTASVLSSTSIRVSWDPVPGATSYEIYYKKGYTSNPMNYAGTTTSMPFTHTHSSWSATFYYYIRAVNDAGFSNYSSEVSISIYLP
ncbi:MAG: fibronectin type III domain-containing protein [Treponema sp.]|jgi:fibronectin type 3 domain-containing protein|nr:fibronectin type III domain-containing protein [Treponema sp.]